PHRRDRETRASDLRHHEQPLPRPGARERARARRAPLGATLAERAGNDVSWRSPRRSRCHRRCASTRRDAVIGRRRNLSIERRELVIEVRSARDVRVDHYLFHKMSWRPRNRVQPLIREGRGTVHGRPAKPSRRVRHGHVVTIRLSSGTGVPDDYDTRSFPTLYEDPWLLALDKPADILVHPVGRHVYDTLINYLHHRYHASGPANKSI